MIEIACPQCSEILSVPDSLAGQQEVCPSCQTPVPIPSAQASPPPVLIPSAEASPPPVPAPPVPPLARIARLATRALSWIKSCFVHHTWLAIGTTAAAVIVLAIAGYFIFRQRGFGTRQELAEMLAANGYHLYQTYPEPKTLRGRRCRAFTYCCEATNADATSFLVYVPLASDRQVLAVTTTYGGDLPASLTPDQKLTRRIHATRALRIIEQLTGVHPETSTRFVKFPIEKTDLGDRTMLFQTCEWSEGGFCVERLQSIVVPKAPAESDKKTLSPITIIIRDDGWNKADAAAPAADKSPPMVDFP